MTLEPLATPVAFFVFNRPTPTRRVFERIAAARPKRLLIVADGPRGDRSGEAELCAEVRDIVSRVDWECEVEHHYSDANLGCRARVSSGLDWVFDRCERAIILEDDCLPDPSFFPFCEELLERYEGNERVTLIAGNGFGDPNDPGPSYRFSRYTLIWGWASWRRAWKNYDLGMARWPEVRDGHLLTEMTGSELIAAYWREWFDRAHAGKVDTWDYQLLFSSWIRDGVAIHPRVNLVSNIGFGADATHTVGDSALANRPVHAVSFPLEHPTRVTVDLEADRKLAMEVYGWVPHVPASRLTRLRGWLSRKVRGALPDRPGTRSPVDPAGVAGGRGRPE